MSEPFSKYQVATSHNTFLGGIQIFTCRSSPAQVRRILEEGARMIELDIFSSRRGLPLVSHGTIWKGRNVLCSPPLTLESVCEQISEFVTPGTSPVIIDLEMNYLKRDRKQVQDATREIFERVLGTLVPVGKINFMTEPPSAYMGKVIITCGNGLERESTLSEYINAELSQVWWFKNRSYKSALESLSNFEVMRSYPPNKILSKNFDPLPLLEANVQFVAMNYQTNDAHMKAYREWFDGQDLVGYRPIK